MIAQAGFPDGGAAGLFADTHGRPLGLEVNPRDGTLIVCDAYRGLLRVETGHVRMLADAYGRRAAQVHQQRRRRGRWHHLFLRQLDPVRH